MLSTKKGVPILLAGEVIYYAVLTERILIKDDTCFSLSGLYAEDGPPTDVADMINASFPNLLMAGLGYRSAKLVAEVDK